MNNVLAKEFERLAAAIEDDPRGDLQGLLDYLSSASMLTQQLGELPELVRFLRACGGKIGGAMHALRRCSLPGHAWSRERVRVEVARVWGAPNQVRRQAEPADDQGVHGMPARPRQR
jgi:hypothetical protein